MKTEGKIWVLFDAASSKKTRPLSVVQAQMMILGLKVRDLRNYFIWTPGWDQWQSLVQYLASNQKYFVQTQPPEPLQRKVDSDLTVKIKTTDTLSGKKNRKDLEVTKPGGQPFTTLVPAESFKKEDYGYYYNEFSGDDLTLSGIPDKPSVEIVVSRSELGSPKDRRMTSRHEFKIEAVLLTKKGTSFRTYSENISLSGTLLEDEIPKEFIHRPFEMILVNKFEKDPQKKRVHLTGRIIGDISDPRRLMFLEQDEETAVKLGKLINDYMNEHSKMKKSTG